jgi:hypothetical protein
MKMTKMGIWFGLIVVFVMGCGKGPSNDRNATGIQAGDVKDAETAARFYSTMRFVRAEHTGQPHEYLQSDPILLAGGPQHHWAKVNVFLQNDHKAYVEELTVRTNQTDPTAKLDGDATSDGFIGTWSQNNMALELHTEAGARVAQGKPVQLPRGSTISLTFAPTFPVAELAGKTVTFFKSSKRRDLKEDLKDIIKHYDLTARNKLDLGEY